MARRPLLALTFYGYDASDRNDGHRQPEVMASRRPHPHALLASIAIRACQYDLNHATPCRECATKRVGAPTSSDKLRQSYDRATTELRHPLYQRIKLVGVSCGRPVPLEQPAITGNSFEGTGRRSAVCPLRSRGGRRRMVPSATGIKNGTVDLPFSREELMGGILNDDSAA